jgi:hypothetical protein
VQPALEQISLRREPASVIDVSRFLGNDTAEDWEGADAGDFGDGGGLSAYGSKRAQYWDNWKCSTSTMGLDMKIWYASGLELLDRRQKTEKDVFQSAINAGFCETDTNNLTSTCPRCAGVAVPHCSPIKAQIITISFAHDVLIPVFLCPW